MLQKMSREGKILTKYLWNGNDADGLTWKWNAKHDPTLEWEGSDLIADTAASKIPFVSSIFDRCGYTARGGLRDGRLRVSC